MKGSLGIWCGPSANVDGHPPQIDLHFNIWCDLPKESPNALDVGILLKDPRTIKSLCFYIPCEVPQEFFNDLSDILEDTNTLAAVFNETLTVGETNEKSFEAKNGDDIALHVIRIDLAEHTSFETIDEGDGRTGTIIHFNESLFANATAVGDHYLRFRIKLDGQLETLFRSEIEPSDRIFTASFFRTEMIEFRVNEKRNFSDALNKRFPDMRMPVILAIRYFLIRDLHVELVRPHADLRKVRRLEPNLWDRYLKPLGQVSLEDMVIYHWVENIDDSETTDGTPKGIEDFVSLTTFRTSGQNIFVFLVIIVLLGAMGSAFQTLLTPAKDWITGTFFIQITIILGLTICVGTLYLVFIPSSRPKILNVIVSSLKWCFCLCKRLIPLRFLQGKQK